MNKIAHYLQEHMQGEVVTSADARTHFATDGGILTLTPQVVVYPRSEQDVRKVARFTWQLAERGHQLPVTARGLGNDQLGASLSDGIAMSFAAHMNKILELDPKRGTVIVQPGALFDKVEQAVITHGRFIPAYPESLQYASVGGAVANNAIGTRSLKYGPIKDFVDSLRVVLANGEVIDTRRLTKKELSRKMGESTFEGEIYRQLDALISDNWATIEAGHKRLEKIHFSAAGYDLFTVKGTDGSFDLTPLFIGSQGTLGFLTEIALSMPLHNPQTEVLAAYFDEPDKLESALRDIAELKPSVLEFVDGFVLQYVVNQNPNYLRSILPDPIPKAALIIEFDDDKESQRKKSLKKAKKILEATATSHTVAEDIQDAEKLWKIRQSVSVLLSEQTGSARAVACIEDAAVEPKDFLKVVEKIYSLFKQLAFVPLIWGSAGDGVIHVEPYLDISQTGDRQKLFRLMDEYYAFIISLGGTTSAGNGDGRLKAPYLPQLVGPDLYAVYEKLKQIFDPYNVLNPGVKTGTTSEQVRAMLRQVPGALKSFDYLPRH